MRQIAQFFFFTAAPSAFYKSAKLCRLFGTDYFSTKYAILWEEKRDLIKGKNGVENRVAERRMELGLTQEELARLSKVSRQTISDIEQGTHIPRLDTALMIAAALDRSIDELFSL